MQTVTENEEAAGLRQRLLPNIDAMVLEEALREVSDGTMTAPLRDVVRLAIERWGFPGSVGAAEAILLQSGYYEVDVSPTLGQVVRPRDPA